MSQQIVYPFGSQEIALTATQSIAVRVSGSDTATISRQVGFPNYPSAFTQLAVLSDQEQVYGPFTGGTVRLQYRVIRRHGIKNNSPVA